MSRITPHTRCLITHEVISSDRHEWKGTRQSVRYRFTLADQPAFDGSRIEWEARWSGHRFTGKARTVPEAIAEIDRQIGTANGPN